MSELVCSSTSKKLKISILADDTAISDKYLKEHALSILIELPNGNRWLVDTGTTDVYIENAKRMGVNIDDLSGILISHGHDDHTGGLSFYPRLKGSPPIYGHPYIWHKAYQIKPNQPVRITGIPYLARTHAASAFKPLNNTVKLDENLYFFTDIPRPKGSFSPTQGNFFNEDGTGEVPLIDDATVVIRTPKGLVLIFGCAHAGYMNILNEIQKNFPEDKLRAVIGGLHLANANDQVLEDAVAHTKMMQTDDFAFYGGHCTGEKAIHCFRNALGEIAIQALGSGRKIVFNH